MNLERRERQARVKFEQNAEERKLTYYHEKRAGRLTRSMNDKSQLGKYSDLTFANESSIW